MGTVIVYVDRILGRHHWRLFQFVQFTVVSMAKVGNLVRRSQRKFPPSSPPSPPSPPPPSASLPLLPSLNPYSNPTEHYPIAIHIPT